jgi:hypothetical protein
MFTQAIFVSKSHENGRKLQSASGLRISTCHSSIRPTQVAERRGSAARGAGTSRGKAATGVRRPGLPSHHRQGNLRSAVRSTAIPRVAPAGARSGHPDGTGTSGAPGREDDDDLHAHAGSPGPRADQPAGADAGSRAGKSWGCSEARRWRERADVDLNRAAQAVMLV